MAPRVKPAPLFLPEQPSTPFKLTNSGTFTEGDLTINRNGLLLAGMPVGRSSPSCTPKGDKPSPKADNEKESTLIRSRPSSANSQGSCSSPPPPCSSAPPPGDDAVDEPSTSEAAEMPVFGLKELKVISQLGLGSSGVVNKVQHKSTGDIYALKMIKMDMQENVRKNILQELRILHNAKCEHIVQCFGSFYDGGIIYSVLEFMDGGSLAHILKTHKKLGERYLAKIAKHVLVGMIYLHKELHIIHRDVKPSNLLVNQAGQVKIADFGVSGKLANSVADCASWVGTVTYMSPERISGACYSFDSDVWSLGLSMMECAEGRFPYTAECNGGHPLSFWDLLDHIVERPAPELVAEKYSPEFRSFVAACMQKEPKKRATTTELMTHPFIQLWEHEPDSILAELVK